MWTWEDEIQIPTIGRTLRSDALGKNPRKSKSSPHMGSNIARLQPGPRKVQARLPTSQPGTLSKARINVNRKTKSTPALVPSKMFQPEAPATGFKRGSGKVSPCSSKGSPSSNDFLARFQQGSSKVPARFQLAGLRQGSSRVPARLQQGSGKIWATFQQGSSNECSNDPAEFQAGFQGGSSKC